MQINLHHCKAAAAELLLSLKKSEVDTALVQEPYLYKNKVAGLSDGNYTTFATSSGDKVRTCIVAKKNLNLMYLSNYSGGDITAVIMQDRSQKSTIFASIYMPYESPDPPGQHVESLIEMMGSTCLIIMGCDANAHHFHWGSSDTNARVTSKLEAPRYPTTTNEVNNAVKHVTEVLMDSYEASSPLTHPGRRSQPVWWSKELANLRKTSRRLYNKANKTKLSTDWENYKVSFNKYNSEIKEAKRKSWICFSETIEGVKDVSRFRKVLSKDPKTIGSIKRDDGTWTNSALEALDLLAKTHFPNCMDVSEQPEALTIHNHTTEDLNVIEEIISRPKIKWAINTFKPFKSPEYEIPDSPTVSSDRQQLTNG
ncbi:uncharacterized protein [Musca autumnalis]|uniref:uncharacterized protein n=1 Tax=Musca autumnalis TaxID=221902 RepID=UPI003CE6BE0B